MQVGKPAKAGVGPAGHGDKPNPHAFNVWGNVEYLGGFTRIGDGQNQVLGLQHAEVTMLRLGGVIDTIPEEYAFPVEAVGAPLAELEVPAGLAELQEARRRCTVVRFGYRGTPREVEPLRIFYQRGWWYLTAYDRGHDEQRHFRVDRMTSVDGEPGPVVVATSEGYDPSRHDPVKPMEDPWAWGEGDPIEATLLIDPGWGMSIIPNLPPDVDVDFNPDGSAVVTLEVRNREGFRWLVLGLLEHGEILGPEELRADLVGWLSDMAGADQ